MHHSYCENLLYYLESVQIFRDLRLYDLLGKSKQFPVSERKCPNRRYLFKNQPSIETFVTELKICTETCVVIVGCYKISEFEFQKYFHFGDFWETIQADRMLLIGHKNTSGA